MLMRCLPFSRGVPQLQRALGLGPSHSRCIPTQEAPGMSLLSLLSSIGPLKLPIRPLLPLLFLPQIFPPLGGPAWPREGGMLAGVPAAFESGMAVQLGGG